LSPRLPTIASPPASSARSPGAVAGPAEVKVGFISLGCPKNTVDSEVMLGHLARAGAELTTEAAEADVIVVNTCGFIEAAKEESIETLLEAARLKDTGRLRRLVVAGCMVQRYGEELRAAIPEIDAFVDLDGLAGIAAAVGLAAPGATGRAGGRMRPVAGDVAARGPRRLPALPPVAAAAATPGAVHPATYLYDAATPRMRTGPRWSAYVKIAEGCDNTCSFCAIPSFRGAFRSRPLADIVSEARRLAGEGVVEINLIAQDSTAYGTDIGLSHGPARLLESLSGVEGLRWIRLFYVYPNKVQDSLLDAIGSLPNVARYIDIPLQHAAREVLARMRRGGSADAHLRLLDRIRARVPGVSLRSTVIVGFPGETEADFEELLEFTDRARFDHLGVFTYSHEDRTGAFELDDDVPAAVKEERRGEIMRRQEILSRQLNAARVGGTFTVLCEGAAEETEHLLQGRLEGQAPEVDGRVLINDGTTGPGEFVRVRITKAHPFDLVGRIVRTA
jgi:ribosomal protein S12 methylthiotransferase